MITTSCTEDKVSMETVSSLRYSQMRLHAQMRAWEIAWRVCNAWPRRVKSTEKFPKVPVPYKFTIPRNCRIVFVIVSTNNKAKSKSRKDIKSWRQGRSRSPVTTLKVLHYLAFFSESVVGGFATGNLSREWQHRESWRRYSPWINFSHSRTFPRVWNQDRAGTFQSRIASGMHTSIKRMVQ